MLALAIVCYSTYKRNLPVEIHYFNGYFTTPTKTFYLFLKNSIKLLDFSKKFLRGFFAVASHRGQVGWRGCVAYRFYRGGFLNFAPE